MRKTLFHVEIRTPRGLRLQDQGGKGLQARLRDPVDSRFCQGIGVAMREAGIEAFEDHSTRSAEDVAQVGAISCCMSVSRFAEEHCRHQHWLNPSHLPT